MENDHSTNGNAERKPSGPYRVTTFSRIWRYCLLIINGDIVYYVGPRPFWPVTSHL